MKKQFYSILIFVASTGSIPLFAQIDNSGIYLTDNKGGVIKGKTSIYESVDGSPYLDDEWTNAEITLKNGDVYKNVLSKINFHTNEVYVLDKQNTEIVIPNQNMGKIVFSKKLVDYEFIVKVNPKNNKLVLFRVLNSGSAQLLRFTERKITETKDFNSAVAMKKFKEESALFLLYKEKVSVVEKNQDFWLNTLNDGSSKIKPFLDSKKGKVKSEKDILELLSLYNN
jgi:hypothetical protein